MTVSTRGVCLGELQFGKKPVRQAHHFVERPGRRRNYLVVTTHAARDFHGRWSRVRHDRRDSTTPPSPAPPLTPSEFEANIHHC